MKELKMGPLTITALLEGEGDPIELCETQQCVRPAVPVTKAIVLVIQNGGTNDIVLQLGQGLAVPPVNPVRLTVPAKGTLRTALGNPAGRSMVPYVLFCGTKRHGRFAFKVGNVADYQASYDRLAVQASASIKPTAEKLATHGQIDWRLERLDQHRARKRRTYESGGLHS